MPLEDLGTSEEALSEETPVTESEETPAETGKATQQQTMSDDEAAQIVAKIESRYEERLRAEGRIKDVEEEKPEAPGSGWGEQFNQWMDEVSGRAMAKYPVREGMSKQQVASAQTKQANFIREHYTKGVISMAKDHIKAEVMKEIAPRLDGLQGSFTDYLATQFAAGRPELSPVINDIRDLVEGRKAPTLDGILKLLDAARQQGAE